MEMKCHIEESSHNKGSNNRAHIVSFGQLSLDLTSINSDPFVGAPVKELLFDRSKPSPRLLKFFPLATKNSPLRKTLASIYPYRISFLPFSSSFLPISSSNPSP